MQNNVDNAFFTKHYRLFLLISAGIVLVAVVLSFFGRGIDMGIDFVGGSMLTYDVGEEFDAQDIEQKLDDMGINGYMVAKIGTEVPQTTVEIRVRLQDDSAQFRQDLEALLKETYPNLSFSRIELVGAVAGQDLIMSAIKSMLIVFACLLVYIAIRFDFFSGLAALFALLHDVLIMCSFMAFFSFLYQVNSPFIAAVLTIVGYSINNTIIIFDRIRELNKKPELRQLSKAMIVERSVRQTLSRTVNTTVTTLLTLVTLYILGVASIREFTFPLIVGMLAGVYSSVLLSGQMWAHWLDHDTFKRVKAVFKKA